MQTFLKTSFLVFFLAFFTILFLFLRKSQAVIKEEVSTQHYRELVAQLPITAITRQIEENRRSRLRNPALQHTFDQALIDQAKRVQNRLNEMNTTESYYYLKTLLTQTEKGLQQTGISTTERYYHLTLLQILYKQGQLKAELP